MTFIHHQRPLQVLLEDARREGIRQLLVQKQSEVSEIRSNLTQSISRIERVRYPTPDLCHVRC